MTDYRITAALEDQTKQIERLADETHIANLLALLSSPVALTDEDRAIVFDQVKKALLESRPYYPLV